jgi:hypothetical protein
MNHACPSLSFFHHHPLLFLNNTTTILLRRRWTTFLWCATVPIGYKCGSLINIPYPFWGDSRPEYYGQHGYNLSCRNNECPVLRFEALEFRVLDINTGTRTFTIARLDLWDGPCPPPSVLFQTTTTLNYTLFDYASTVQNITLLYDRPPNQDNIPPAPYRFNCRQFGYAVLTPRSRLSAIAVTKCNLIHVQSPVCNALFSSHFLNWIT